MLSTQRLDRGTAPDRATLKCFTRFLKVSAVSSSPSSALTNLSLGYTLVARWLGLGLPYSFPESLSASFFADFFVFRERFYLVGTPAFFHRIEDFMYPPAMVLPLKAFYSTSHPFWAFPSFFSLPAPSSPSVSFASCAISRLRLPLQRSWPLAWPSRLIPTCIFCSVETRKFSSGLPSPSAYGCSTAGTTHGRLSVSAWPPPSSSIPLSSWVFSCRAVVTSRSSLGRFVTVAVTLIGLRALSPSIGYAFHWDMGQLQAFGRYYAASPSGTLVTTTPSSAW